MEARSDSVVEEGESEPKCSCRCCACCGSKAKGWLLLFFALLAVLFAVGALASPWYFVYDETADATVNTYYQWSGLLRVSKGHDGAPDSTTTLSWGDVNMPQTRTLFMTTLVLAVMSLFLAIVLTGCVLCLILLPAYRFSHRFILAESGINKSKWKWTFGLAVLLCFVALLLSFTLFVQLPDCLAKDSPDHSCSSNECGSFIGGQRQKGGYLHIYTPFVGWGSAVASCIFVSIVGTLFLALFGLKRKARAPGLALATINATEHSRREATPDPVDDDDDAAGERRPLLAGEKAEKARRADSPGSPSRDNGGLHHRTTSSAKTSPKAKAEDATIDDCDSPLAYHKPCPSSPSLARMQPLIALTSPRHTPSSLANLDSRFAAAATPTFVDPKEETPLLEVHGETEAERNGGTQGSESAREANISSTSTTHGDADTANSEGASEEAKKTKGEGEQRTEDTEKDDKQREGSAPEATAGDAAVEEKESASDAEPQAVEGGGRETQGETMKEAKEAEQKEKAEGEQEEDPTPKPVARRAFATMQRMSYKDYAKKKAPPPTPESVLGPSRVRGVPTNRMALRSRGAPLSSVRDQALATSPSRSATMPAATRRLPTTVARPRAVLASEDTERPTTQPEPEEREKEETKESEKIDKEKEEEEESKTAGEQTNDSDDATHSVAATVSTTTVTGSHATKEDDDRSDSAS